ncbi:MAG: hypothetical protein A2719_03995 [Candidatus Ryanbacteria bacterium RIFCSPHIGHO2_01_FULL_45_22]|uniref:Uncharacterized protein n=1 Tax=Candidatus Ryanbacteria bacterium RIFCSPHIGHO2_01_FULL_45_22 TaxID=1802114 RepID=A0A1G2G3M5_9BACT|nr:MAG: hypothetical protein A2719_03995 [Candidatus Ryanbacteria bacterium RIFCSPHIGHO2_01_FULL_45_22]
MAFEWRTKRKATFLSLFLLIVLIPVVFVFYSFLPVPSCTDGKLNQQEEQIDCGGPNCASCLSEQPDDLVILWSRYFEVRPGVYDVAALVENVNLTLGSLSLPFVFELYDDHDSRIVAHRGSTYALPNKQFLIFSANVGTGIRKPVRMNFRLDSFTWERLEEQTLPLIVSRTERLFDIDRPRLIATLTNSALHDITQVDVAVVVSDSSNNAIAVGEVRLDEVRDSSTADAAFTWPHPFSGTPDHVQFFVRQKP